jgi:hypothetical protein
MNLAGHADPTGVATGYLEPWNAGTISTSPLTCLRTCSPVAEGAWPLLPAAGGECSLELCFEFLDLARPLA